MLGSRGGTWVPDPHPETSLRGFSSNTGPDPLKIAKATKPTFNVGPLMAFRWLANYGPLIAVLGSSLPNQLKNKKKS